MIDIIVITKVPVPDQARARYLTVYSGPKASGAQNSVPLQPHAAGLNSVSGFKFRN